MTNTYSGSVLTRPTSDVVLNVSVTGKTPGHTMAIPSAPIVSGDDLRIHDEATVTRAVTGPTNRYAGMTLSPTRDLPTLRSPRSSLSFATRLRRRPTVFLAQLATPHQLFPRRLPRCASILLPQPANNLPLFVLPTRSEAHSEPMGQSIGSLFPLKFRLWLGGKLFRPLDSNATVRVSWHRIIKGPCNPGEVEAMQYVAKHTTIPLPKVYAVHTTREKHIYIEMEYIPGLDLDTAWRHGHLTPDQKKTIFADIKAYVSILRALPPPAEDLVGSALQNPVYDARVGYRVFGPFNHHDFHALLRQDIPMEHVGPYLGEQVVKVHTSSYRTCFTHADLVARNIIVRNGRVAAIIDWGFSGWYPEYWEFTKAHYDAFPGEDWPEYIRQALPRYDTELEAEQTLDEMVPEPGSPATFYREGITIKKAGSGPSAAWLKARADCRPNDLWSIALSSDRFQPDGKAFCSLTLGIEKQASLPLESVLPALYSSWEHESRSLKPSRFMTTEKRAKESYYSGKLPSLIPMIPSFPEIRAGRWDMHDKIPIPLI
ncbi:hypothetical protein ACRALDRAFT_213793 [Sodiomyces alcalophilus JCM 7366]|uniref:uncharacterized protein n=1 Tax=Sodiomyces alcalophilus JCM 7366 TaxID=591952 RepID=UPI0039B69956